VRVADGKWIGFATGHWVRKTAIFGDQLFAIWHSRTSTGFGPSGRGRLSAKIAKMARCDSLGHLVLGGA
jgi:hypothetical protein